VVPIATRARQAARRASLLVELNIGAMSPMAFSSRMAPLPSAASCCSPPEAPAKSWRKSAATLGSSLQTRAVRACPRSDKGKSDVRMSSASAETIEAAQERLEASRATSGHV
jgi:hypothetical protein